MNSSASAPRASQSDPVQVLSFALAGHRFALPLKGVAELTRAFALQALPQAPSVVCGVLNLRGEVVPVLSLRRRFGLPEKELSSTDYFVFAAVGARRVALLVDRVLSVDSLSALPAEHTPNLAPLRLEYVSGVAAVADGVVLIHDLNSFLNAAEDVELTRALGSARPELT